MGRRTQPLSSVHAALDNCRLDRGDDGRQRHARGQRAIRPTLSGHVRPRRQAERCGFGRMRLRSANVRKVDPGQCGDDSDKMTLDPQDSRF
jgi:hypothetical protein